jgi:hypothetical protein
MHPPCNLAAKKDMLLVHGVVTQLLSVVLHAGPEMFPAVNSNNQHRAPGGRWQQLRQAACMQAKREYHPASKAFTFDNHPLRRCPTKPY